MSAVADWYGRVIVSNLSLRGDIPAACTKLNGVLRNFDYKKAAVPPYKVAEWAVNLVKKDQTGAMATVLDALHPTKGGRPAKRPTFKEFAEIYRSLDMENETIAFCENYIAACVARVPPYGGNYRGYAEEAALLKEMTYAANDSIKFKAIEGYGKFGPVSDIYFFAERAAKKTKNSRNPNVVLCRCATAVGLAAARFGGVTNAESAADYAAILETLSFLTEILDTQGRNNGACLLASNSIGAVVSATGAPEALEAFLHNLNGPTATGGNARMKDMAEKYNQRALGTLENLTGNDFGTDYKMWQKWLAANAGKLFYDARQEKYVVNPRAAAAYRKGLAKAAKKR